MTDSLAKWRKQNRPTDIDILEREAERQWSWILSRFQISEVLNNPDGVRSIASHWGKFSLELDPNTFLLKDLGDLSQEFVSYLREKGKPFDLGDICSFMAWKFWEAKVGCQRVFCPEMQARIIAWSGTKTFVTQMYEAANRARKTRRRDIAECIAEKLYSAFEAKDKEDRKQIVSAIESEIREMLEYDDREIFDAVRDCVTLAINSVVSGTVDSRLLLLSGQNQEDEVA